MFGAFSQTQDLESFKQLLVLFFLNRTKPKRGMDGIAIQLAIFQSGGKELSHGELYTYAKRLRRLELIDSYEGETTSMGIKRQYYFLTEKGAEELSKVKSTFFNLINWQI
jgi:DNA-binding PadR family transcriptional regulator